MHRTESWPVFLAASVIAVACELGPAWLSKTNPTPETTPAPTASVPAAADAESAIMSTNASFVADVLAPKILSAVDLADHFATCAKVTQTCEFDDLPSFRIEVGEVACPDMNNEVRARSRIHARDLTLRMAPALPG